MPSSELRKIIVGDVFTEAAKSFILAMLRVGGVSQTTEWRHELGSWTQVCKSGKGSPWKHLKCSVVDPGERAVVTLRNGNLQIMVAKLLGSQVGEGGVCQKSWAMIWGFTNTGEAIKWP